MRDSPACDDRPPPIPPPSPRRRKPRRSAPAPARRGRRRAGRRSAGSRPSLPPRCGAGGAGKTPRALLRGLEKDAARRRPSTRSCPGGLAPGRAGSVGWACKRRAWRTDGGRPCSGGCARSGAALPAWGGGGGERRSPPADAAPLAPRPPSLLPGYPRRLQRKKNVGSA